MTKGRVSYKVCLSGAQCSETGIREMHAMKVREEPRHYRKEAGRTNGAHVTECKRNGNGTVTERKEAGRTNGAHVTECKWNCNGIGK